MDDTDSWRIQRLLLPILSRLTYTTLDDTPDEPAETRQSYPYTRKTHTLHPRLTVKPLYI